MTNNFFSPHHDLVTPDGLIRHITSLDERNYEAEVLIENISPAFVGFAIEKERIFFNLKSTIAQLGVNAKGIEYVLSPNLKTAEVKVHLSALDDLGALFLPLLQEGAFIGKIFGADERRRVRDPHYLSRMFGRSDRKGRPLLSLGGLHGSGDLILEKVEGRTVAFLSLKPGVIHYQESIKGFLPTLAKSLQFPEYPTRKLLALHQEWKNGERRGVVKGQTLLVRTLPLHVRTVFGRVVPELLPQGVFHTSASVLQPDTRASGDVYELYGESEKEITDIPLEFYTLHPYREHVFFSDRDQLQTCLDNPKSLFQAFETAPLPIHHHCAVFCVKGEQLLELSPKKWVHQEPQAAEFPGLRVSERQALMVARYIHQQPTYPFLKAIEDGEITSQGILLTRYFPSPLMKRMLLSERVQNCLKGIYFQFPSRSSGDYFSHEDRSVILDFAKFGIPVYWVDRKTEQILQYVPKPGKDSGMFVPISKVSTFIKATMLGIYGSNLIASNIHELLEEFLKGLLELKKDLDHHLLNPEVPLALVTGGGPGTMSVGNQIAKSLGILSCANIIDFTSNNGEIINEQEQNPYIDAKMTYRLDRLVERQAEFNLDLPLFFMGGIGTDFEYALEEVRRKIGINPPTPVLLFGPPEYWKAKISSRFQTNLQSGTIAGSEWVSNCFYCIQNARDGLQVYKDFFSGNLNIGKKGQVFKHGFHIYGQEN